MAHLGPTLRRSRRQERPWLRTLLAIALSLGLNLLALTRLDASWLGFGRYPEIRPVELAPLAAADWERNRVVRDGSRAAPALPPPPAPPAPPPPSVMPGQVVDVGDQPPDPQRRRPPSDSRFVSDRDRYVERETRSRLTKSPGQATAPTPSSGSTTQAAPLTPPQGDGGKDARTAAAAPGSRGRITGAEPVKVAATERSSRPDLPEDGKADYSTAQAQAPQASSAAGADGLLSAGQRDPRLAVSPSTLARLAGGPSNDFLKGVEEGDGTFLNTREWKYATYFNRIKEAVSGAWDVRQALEQRDPDRSIYAFKDRYTLVSVTLDDHGGLKDLAVARTSHVDFLDRVAMDAFRKAQPFANPPPGLVDAAGQIRFQFGFYVEAGRPGFHLFRGPMP
jgi:TonB family protein